MKEVIGLLDALLTDLIMKFWKVISYVVVGVSSGWAFGALLNFPSFLDLPLIAVIGMVSLVSAIIKM